LVNPFSGNVEHPDGRRTDFETGAPVEENYKKKVNMQAQVNSKKTADEIIKELEKKNKE